MVVTDLKHIYWRSRRGMLELELQLIPFVRDHYADLSEQEQRCYEQMLDLEDWQLLQDSAVSPGNIDVSEDINERLIGQRMVLLQQPCSAQHLPQMLGLEELGAVDFDKGCYLGQEVVARAQFRGAVKRGLDIFNLAAASNVAVTLGQSLTLDGVKGDVVMIGAQHGLWVTRL